MSEIITKPRHSSIVLIQAGNILLVNSYDDTYPYTAYRGRVRLVGGNQESQDRGPLSLIRREVDEEIRGTGVEFAPQSYLDALRSAILERIRPCNSYLCTVPSIPGGVRQPYQVIGSLFRSEIPSALMHNANRFTRERLRLTNEGNLYTVSLDELVAGKPLMAHANGVIVADHLGLPIPNPDGVAYTPLGPVRTSFLDY